ncbi:MAG: pyruvate:ferredoxin (flavodoxin) oxidoreductase [bacterium]|nr:pyruvate:ferredoxin (flavodoxin) oxidoreductase [bacterium]
MKKIVDGNTACSNIANLFTEIASIYPITPSSPMASNIDNLKLKKKNLFNEAVEVVEMQSEAGAAGAMHGALISGSLATTFTASQGLLLMIPNMYKIAGEGLPGVIHVAARTVATHALSIFGDHSDIYATRQTGFAMLASTNVYDAQNLAAVAHLAAIEASVPFLHFFDGFRTSHELNSIEELPDIELLKLINYDKVKEFKNKALNVGCNYQRGMAENEDIYFQSVEARNKDYDVVPDIVNNYMQKINEIMNTSYAPFNYYGANNATHVIVAMGSVCDTIKLTIDELNKNNAIYGLVEVHLYRPFSSKYLKDILPKTVKNIAVLDRTKESGSIGEPLYLDVLAALNDTDIKIVGGRYGLSSKNTTPSDIAGVYKMLTTNLKNNFTIGIFDDVTNLSLEPVEMDICVCDKEILIYGYGSDGMVSTSKDIMHYLGEEENLNVQGYFQYDSKKSGGVTVSNLRVSKESINAPFYVTKPSLLVITKDAYLKNFDMFTNVCENGICLINTNKKSIELDDILPNKAKEAINAKNLKVLLIDADKIALENGIKGKISKIMEIVILKLLGFNDAENYIKESIKKKFATKGDDIINANINSLSTAIKSVTLVQGKFKLQAETASHDSIFTKINNREGDSLKVSDLMPFKNGIFPCGLASSEKRKIATQVPIWHRENCIQCGMCATVCPHAVIRPIITEAKDDTGLKVLGHTEYNYEIVVSEADCTSCGLCINACPGKMGKKALEFGEATYKNQEYADAMFKNHHNPELFDRFTLKGASLRKPCFEFSGACAGCGETPYLKMLSQLFGEKLVIANATGCSSIYGGSAPSTPYLIPWANSLFEDNAEFGYGMYLTYKNTKKRIIDIINKCLDCVDEDEKELLTKWLENQDNYEATKEIVTKLKTMTIPEDLKDVLPYMVSRSVFIVGGDGWAYDIGFGGIDHVLSSGENVNILVLDTEVYSNTGGQASKSSRVGAVAEFANMGKKTAKKDLFRIAMSYPNCYIGSISFGANFMQTIKTMKEAEAHEGPSLIICYCPCIEQGLHGGMSNSINEEKLAVECGYVNLMRYIPEEKKLYIDSKEPDFNKYENFLKNEVRYSALAKKDNELAKDLLDIQIANAKERYEFYKNIANK